MLAQVTAEALDTLMKENKKLLMHYPAASGLGINCGHSRGLLIGNPETS